MTVKRKKKVEVGEREMKKKIDKKRETWRKDKQDAKKRVEEVTKW